MKVNNPINPYKMLLDDWMVSISAENVKDRVATHKLCWLDADCNRFIRQFPSYKLAFRLARAKINLEYMHGELDELIASKL